MGTGVGGVSGMMCNYIVVGGMDAGECNSLRIGIITGGGKWSFGGINGLNVDSMLVQIEWDWERQ